MVERERRHDPGLWTLKGGKMRKSTKPTDNHLLRILNVLTI